jgi:nicotinamidase-related amidase
VPVLVTVEEPVENGATAAPVRACLPADVPERDKRVFGLCDQDDIRDAVLAQPRRTAVLVGLETDVCILHSAVGLRQNGFRVVVVSDATGAPGDEHELGLERAAAFGAEFVHAKGLYYEWVRSLEGLRRAKTPHPIRPPLGSGL